MPTSKLEPLAIYQSLNYGESYTICVNLGTESIYSCNSICYVTKKLTECVDVSTGPVSTHCEKLPTPQKRLKQILWIPESDFNPFTEVKLEMEENTFDGEKSGLHEVKIV